MADYSAPLGAPIWFDLMSSDPDRAAAFYGEIFGWESEPPRDEFGGYRNFTKNGKRVALIGAGPASLTVARAAKALGLSRQATTRLIAEACKAHLLREITQGNAFRRYVIAA